MEGSRYRRQGGTANAVKVRVQREAVGDGRMTTTSELVGSHARASESTRWGQLVFGIICMVMIANLQYGWTLFVNPIDQKYQWGRAAIQVAFTIFVLTETGRHAEIALAALGAGKHVVITKPMEATLDACDEMIRTAEARGRLLAVDFNRRFTTELNTLREVISQGRLGRLLNGSFALKIRRTMDYFHGDGGWRGTRRWDGGGVLSNQSIHHIDILAFAVGVLVYWGTGYGGLRLVESWVRVALLVSLTWVAAAIAWRWEHIGGVLLLGGGLVNLAQTAFLLILSAASPVVGCVCVSFVLTLIAALPVAAGTLFLASWWKTRASEGPEDTNRTQGEGV